MSKQFRTLSDIDTMMMQMGMSEAEKKKMRRAMKASGMKGMETMLNGGSMASKKEMSRMQKAKHKKM